MKNNQSNKYNRLLSFINDEDVIKNIIKRLNDDIRHTSKLIKQYKYWLKFTEYKDDKDINSKLQREVKELLNLKNKKNYLSEYLKIK